MNLRLSYLALLGIVALARPCTIFVCARDGRVLAGNNEDYVAGDFKTWLKFTPKGSSKYGCATWSYVGMEFPQGGMNEAGLFYDGNALPDKDDKAGKGPKVEVTAMAPLMYRMLHECATVGEAAAFLHSYDLPIMAPAQLVIGDKTGHSLILERSAVTAGDGHLQIGTNFRTSTTPKSKITCVRYQAVDRIMGSTKPLTVDLVKSALDATHASNKQYQTWYSTVCDLKAASFWLYVKGDFSKAYKFDLKQELAKGERKLLMHELAK